MSKKKKKNSNSNTIKSNGNSHAKQNSAVSKKQDELLSVAQDKESTSEVVAKETATVNDLKSIDEAFSYDGEAEGEALLPSEEAADWEIVTDDEPEPPYESKPKAPMSKKDRLLVICAVSFVAVALIVGLVIGLINGGQGRSELTDQAFAEIRARVKESCIVPEIDGYTAKGTLLFGKKLSYEEMKRSENNEYIVQYELIYTSMSGSGKGFVFTATNTDSDKLDVSLLTLAEGYEQPIYLDGDIEEKCPIYVQFKASENGDGVVTLCFERGGQIIGVAARYNDVDKAVSVLKHYIELILIKSADINI